MKHEKLVKTVNTQTISLSGTIVESLRRNSETRTTVRVYEDNKIGIAGQIGKADENALMEKAKQGLSQGIPYPCLMTGGGKRHELHAKEIIPQNDFVKVITALVKRLEKSFPDFCFDNKITLRNIENSYVNSEGTDYAFSDSNIAFELVMRDKRLANIMDLGYMTSRKYYNEDEVVADIAKTISAYDNKIEIPSQKLPIIFDESIFSFIFKDIIAEYYMSGTSLLNGKLGEKVFNENFNAVSNRSFNQDSIVPFFDDEGNTKENDRFEYFKDGVFKGLIATNRSASMFNIASSATAESAFDAVPSFGLNGFEVLPTHKSLNELAKKAILIEVTSGGDITPDGNLGLPVQLAYLYENGKITARLPEFMISGNIFDILGKGFYGAAKSDYLKFSEKNLLVLDMEIKTN